MNIIKKICLCLCCLVVFTGCSKEKDMVEVKSIDKSLAIEKMDNGAILIDVRSAAEYKTGYIDGAINIDVNDILTLKNDLTYNNRSINKNSVIIVYCRSGNRSRQAANKLIELGYTEVYDLGSIDNWS